MTAMAQALRTALLGFVWQGLVVAFLLWVALYLLRKRTAQARYLAACAALALMAALPVATVWVGYRAPTPAAPSTAAPAAAHGTAATTASSAAAIAWTQRLEPWALPLWSAGVLFFSLRLVWSSRRVSMMRRRGRPADAEILAIVARLASRMGLSRRVAVLTAALPDGPSVAGWLRPVLLLPPAMALGLTPEQLEAVLAHELAHLHRYDHLVNAVQTLVETLLFYHPAVWWVSLQIREERELCCDDLAVRACGDALSLARALTKLERLRIVAPASALGSTGGWLTYRVQRLIGSGSRECAPSKLSGILAFSLGVACLALNVHGAQSQDPMSRPASYTIAVGFSEEGDVPGVSVDLGGAALLHRTRVEYPEAVREKGVQGTVAVQVTLDATGNVSDARVVSGPMELRRTVMSSVFDWHFAQDSAGSERVVSVTFDKAAADADAAKEPHSKPVTVHGRVFTYDSANNRSLIWNTPTPDVGVVSGTIDGVPAPVTVESRGVLVAPDSFEPDTRDAKLAELRSLREQLQREPLGQRSRTEEQIRNVEAEVGGVLGAHPIIGSVIKTIEVNGLSDSARNDLLSRLPVHVGDTVPASMEAVGAAVKKFDEHLEFRVEFREDGGVTLRISAPGSR